MATEKELLVTRIFFRAAFPVMKVLLEDDPKTAKKFRGVNSTVEFSAKDEGGDVGAHLKFTDGSLEVVPELAEKPDLAFRFSSVAKMNTMFTGKPVLPSIKGITKVGLLIKVFGLLMGLKLLMPDAKPKTLEQARMKVKMTLYMISTALSQLNRSGDPDMVKWTTKQPERIYQWSREPEGIACYLRVKAGNTKAGRGYYTRRQPFVRMKFNGVDGAMAVLSNSVDLVEAVGKGHVASEGSPEYGSQIGDFMVKIASLVA